MDNFKSIDIKDFIPDVFGLKNKWMLVTAAKANGSVNTMTASWGGFGVMWNKEVAFVVIRPQRYTKEFVDEATSFSLTFFDKSYLKTLGYLGKVSGRDENKLTQSGLTVAFEDQVPYFEEAETAIFVKKLYAQPMAEEFFLEGNNDIIDKWFPAKDFHVLYIAEITKILTKKAQ